MGSPSFLSHLCTRETERREITGDLLFSYPVVRTPCREPLPAVSSHCRLHPSLLNLHGIHCCSFSIRCLSSSTESANAASSFAWENTSSCASSVVPVSISVSSTFTHGVSTLFSSIFAFSHLALKNAIWIES